MGNLRYTSLPMLGSSLSAAEVAELAELHRVVRVQRLDGSYPHWNGRQRDRVRELFRKQDPSIRFAPSTEDMARRFGHLSQR